MNYYNEIRDKLIDNQTYIAVKDYSKNKHDLITRYEVGKLLYEAGKHYGEGIIKEYSKKLTIEFGKGFTTTNLKYYRQLYIFLKSHALRDKLNWSHDKLLIPLKDINEINYYNMIPDKKIIYNIYEEAIKELF